MNKSSLLVSIVCVAFAISCSENEPNASVNDLSAFAQEFMGMRLGSPNAANRSSEAAINQSFRNMMGGVGFAAGRTAGDSTDSENPDWSDTTIYYDPWISCAIVTTNQNLDGSTTTTYDYGDGCEEGWGDYKYFMFGKTAQTYKYVSQQDGSVFRDTYLFKMVYDNYGGSYGNDSSDWLVDGNSHYEGYSSYDVENNKFSGAYVYKDSLIHHFGGTNYNYYSIGNSKYDEKGLVIEESDYEYGNGVNYYRSNLVEPIIYDYTCNTFQGNDFQENYVWVAVSGKEIISYNQDGKEGSFEIDYGNGECDNIVFITENGVRVQVDLSTGWFSATNAG